MVPILFTRGFERALVIGLGTGHTLRVLARFPFREIDAVEISPSIVEAARRWFGDINEAVFDRDPRVKLSVADGRNFLLVAQKRFDLISIEISSIWISGEADLYNQEFYELCRARLTDQGVLQQWVQVHHMRTADLLVILNTATRVFPHVAFFLGPEQGLLIGSPAPLTCDYRNIVAFDADPGVQWELAGLRVPSLASLLGELVLYDESYRKALMLLPPLTGLPAEFASTDDRPYLEYQTPKGNTLLYDTMESNVRFLLRFRPPRLPPEMPLEGLPSENEKQLLLGYVAEARGDLATALECFRRVTGAARPRAELEIRRLEPGRVSAPRRRPSQARQE
jgi:spermidine synthase